MIGRNIPEVTLKTRVRDESVDGDNPFRWQDVNTKDLFAGKRIAVFSLPGAFTPTCTNEQCPAFERLYDEFKARGVDEVYCISVNDAFVMYQWGKSLGLEKIKLLPDGSDDGVVSAWFEEPGINDDGVDNDPYVESTPEKLLNWLDQDEAERKAA